MKSVELLAPARDLATGLAAINCGADAIYIGAARFGARQAAGNTLDDIEQLVAYAHRYWARVYAVVNTLLFDSELEDAVRLTHQLYQVGVDALIVQDAGLLECDLPPLPLFASTQMHNHTPERVAFLEKAGFQRVILARELSLAQIAAIRAVTSVELEAFIHGALCVGYSGQCYLSYAVGGRSGNRGQCAQPCRRRYSLIDAAGRVLVKDRYLLSLKDLNLTNDLHRLLAVGVTSFKIEGRLKGPAYVANVVAHYRRQLDALLPEMEMRPASSGTVALDFDPDPSETFNRGYTRYFIAGRQTDLASPDTPKHIGEPVGRVAALLGDSFTLDTSFPLHNGDGITFFDAAGELQGTTVNRVVQGRVYPARMDGITLGLNLYRNHNHDFLQRVVNTKTQRKMAVTLCFTETDEGFCLSAEDEDGVVAQAVLPCVKTPAQKPEQARQTLERQLTRLGDTDFSCTHLTLVLSQDYFLPLSEINALRRTTLEKLAEMRRARFPRLSGGVLRNAEPFPASVLSFEGNVLNHKAEAFYRRHGVTCLQPAAESGLDLKGKRVMTTGFCLKHQMQACPHEASHDNSLPEPVFLLDGEGQRLQLAFNCRDCVMEVYFGSKKAV
ncbi:MAG: peptidase U32 family protein [Chloroflexota bacterium]